MLGAIAEYSAHPFRCVGLALKNDVFTCNLLFLFSEMQMAGPGILQLSRMGVVLISGASSQLSTISKLRELSSRENLCYRAS